MYYGTPCQVRFVDCGDPNNITKCGGIAYHDEIICGCCGTRYAVKVLAKDGITVLPWISIVDEIIGY